MILWLCGIEEEGKKMIMFNGLPVNGNPYAIRYIPMFNNVSVSVDYIDNEKEGKSHYEISYFNNDRFKEYNYKADTQEQAIKYIFNVHNMNPFHTFLYCYRSGMAVPKDMRMFIEKLCTNCSPLLVSLIGLRGFKERFSIWLGGSPTYIFTGSEDFIICKNDLGFKETRDFFEDKISTYNGPILFDVPWYARDRKCRLDEYSRIIPVLARKTCNSENSAVYGTLMWTDGMSFFHENIFGNNADDYAKNEKEIISSIKTIHKGRRVQKYTRSSDCGIWNYFPEGYVTNWTGYRLDFKDHFECDV